MTKRRRSQNTTLVKSTSALIRPGLVSGWRAVPRSVSRPPYALTGDPGPSRSSAIRTPDELVRMRRAGALAAEILLDAMPLVAPGVTTDRIDVAVHDRTVELGGYPSPLNYRGFPKSVCTSVNEVICHGIPDSRPLAEGDIINIDVTIFIDGVHGDTSATFPVGDIDDASWRLVRETRAAMYAGLAAARSGVPVNVIGRAIEQHARQHNLGVVREFIGHGIGTEFHTSLQIPHYYDRWATTRLEPAMTFTVEPMLTLGSPDLYVWDDDWTAATLDGGRSAQFEHMLAVTDDGVEIMTVTPAGACAADHLA